MEYRFVVLRKIAGSNPSRYETLYTRDYSTANVWNYQTALTAAPAAKLVMLQVYARPVGSTATFQVYSRTFDLNGATKDW